MKAAASATDQEDAHWMPVNEIGRKCPGFAKKEAGMVEIDIFDYYYR